MNKVIAFDRQRMAKNTIMCHTELGRGTRRMSHNNCCKDPVTTERLRDGMQPAATMTLTTTKWIRRPNALGYASDAQSQVCLPKAHAFAKQYQQRWAGTYPAWSPNLHPQAFSDSPCQLEGTFEVQF